MQWEFIGGRDVRTLLSATFCLNATVSRKMKGKII